jgi:cytosine/creatinine deaminase
MRLLVRNARLGNTIDPTDILIEDGKYRTIAATISDGADETVDAKGNLVSPTFVDPHLHIDKVYTALPGQGRREQTREETLEESIKLMHDIKRGYTVEDVRERAVRAIRQSVVRGATKIRANADIDTIGGLTGLRGCLAAREETREIADVQIVAFPQEGIFRDEGAEKLMWEAIDLGADVVGGMPAAEWIAEDARRHVDLVFEIARKNNLDIDMHMDQSKDPFDQSLEYTALKSMREGYSGRVTGGHCTSLAYQPAAHAAKVIELLRAADFHVCVNPQTLAIMGVDPEPRTRGISRVRELVAAGVNVGTSQDTICDGFHIYGTGDPLDYGLLMAYQAQYNSTATASIVYDMLTVNSARIMGIDNYGIAVGNPADFNIIEAPSLSEALRTRPSRTVYRAGRLIARYDTSSEVLG